MKYNKIKMFSIIKNKRIYSNGDVYDGDWKEDMRHDKASLNIQMVLFIMEIG